MAKGWTGVKGEPSVGYSRSMEHRKIASLYAISWTVRFLGRNVRSNSLTSSTKSSLYQFGDGIGVEGVLRH